MMITWGGGRHTQAKHERLHTHTHNLPYTMLHRVTLRQKSTYKLNCVMRFTNFLAAHAEVVHGASQKRISYHQMPTGCQQVVHAIYIHLLWHPPPRLLHPAKLADCNCKQLAATWCCLHFPRLIFPSTMRIDPHRKMAPLHAATSPYPHALISLMECIFHP